MKTFTVCVGFYDQDSRATIVVEAENIGDACREAVRQVDDGEVSTGPASWDPSATFVHGVVEGLRDPFDGMDAVPAEFQDPLQNGPIAGRIVAALRNLIAECNAHLDYEDDEDMAAAVDAAEEALAAAEAHA